MSDGGAVTPRTKAKSSLDQTIVNLQDAKREKKLKKQQKKEEKERKKREKELEREMEREKKEMFRRSRTYTMDDNASQSTSGSYSPEMRRNISFLKKLTMRKTHYSDTESENGSAREKIDERKTESAKVSRKNDRHMSMPPSPNLAKQIKESLEQEEAERAAQEEISAKVPVESMRGSLSKRRMTGIFASLSSRG